MELGGHSEGEREKGGVRGRNAKVPEGSGKERDGFAAIVRVL
jgi:hypothetical protein